MPEFQKRCFGTTLVERGCFASCFHLSETIGYADAADLGGGELLIVSMDTDNSHPTGLRLRGSEPLERRRQIRFGLHAPVHFSWTDRDGMIHKGEGFSRDISSHGVYVYADWHVQPQSDAAIQVDILLHSFSETSRSARMSGLAKIIRVEPSATDVHNGGFVAASDSFAFKDG